MSSSYSRVQDTNIAVQIVDVIIKDFCDLAIGRPLVHWAIAMTPRLNDLNTFSQVTSRVDDTCMIIRIAIVLRRRRKQDVWYQTSFETGYSFEEQRQNGTRHQRDRIKILTTWQLTQQN